MDAIVVGFLLIAAIFAAFCRGFFPYHTKNQVLPVRPLPDLPPLPPLESELRKRREAEAHEARLATIWADSMALQKATLARKQAENEQLQAREIDDFRYRMALAGIMDNAEMMALYNQKFSDAIAARKREMDGIAEAIIRNCTALAHLKVRFTTLKFEERTDISKTKLRAEEEEESRGKAGQFFTKHHKLLPQFSYDEIFWDFCAVHHLSGIYDMGEIRQRYDQTGAREAYVWRERLALKRDVVTLAPDTKEWGYCYQALNRRCFWDFHGVLKETYGIEDMDEVKRLWQLSDIETRYWAPTWAARRHFEGRAAG